MLSNLFSVCNYYYTALKTAKMPDQQVIHSKGIFHGLPVYDKSSSSPKVAIITGANGISGFHTLRVLAAAPERWSKIYALSRRPPGAKMMDLLGEGKSRVEHVACDFLSSPQEIADAIKGKVEKADVVFFYSYLQPGKLNIPYLWIQHPTVKCNGLKNKVANTLQNSSRPRRSSLVQR